MLVRIHRPAVFFFGPLDFLGLLGGNYGLFVNFAKVALLWQIGYFVKHICVVFLCSGGPCAGGHVRVCGGVEGALSGNRPGLEFDVLAALPKSFPEGYLEAIFLREAAPGR